MNKQVVMYAGGVFAFLLLGGLWFVTLYVYPFWPFWFSDRPMFSHWVGASHTAWEIQLPKRDKFGTWFFWDEHLSLGVVYISPTPTTRAPLQRVSSQEALFGADGFQVTLRNSDSKRIVAVSPKGESKIFVISESDAINLSRAITQESFGSEENALSLVAQICEVLSAGQNAELIEYLKSFSDR